VPEEIVRIANIKYINMRNLIVPFAVPIETLEKAISEVLLVK
jgi:hypothetical protein